MLGAQEPELPHLNILRCSAPTLQPILIHMIGTVGGRALSEVALQHLFFCLTCHEREVTSLSAANSLRPSTCFIASGAVPFIFIAPRNLITEYTQHLVSQFDTTVNRLVQNLLLSLLQSDENFKQSLITSTFIYIKPSLTVTELTTVSLLILSQNFSERTNKRFIDFTLRHICFSYMNVIFNSRLMDKS